MRSCLWIALLLTFNFVILSCKSSQQPSQQAKQTESSPLEKAANESSEPANAPAQPEATGGDEKEDKNLYDIFAPKEQVSLSYNGYTILKELKTVKNAPMMSHPFETPNIRVMKDGKLMGTYIKFRGSPMTVADFGLFNLLGKADKQLIIGETEPRSGRFWIISLFPTHRVLFDTNEYNGSRQEMWVRDIDKDGVYELKVVSLGCTSIGTPFNMLSTPQPLIIFKYDEQANRYLPANHLLKDHALEGIEERIEKLDSTAEKPAQTNRQLHEGAWYFREMTEIFLDYVYAGEEKKGWVFFDKFYNLLDKKKVKRSIKSDLRKDKIYRFIYRHPLKHRA